MIQEMLLQTIAFVLCNFSPLIADRCRFGNKHLSSFPSIRKKTTHQKMATCFEFNSCQSAFCTTLPVNSTGTKRCLPKTNKPQRCLLLNQTVPKKEKAFVRHRHLCRRSCKMKMLAIYERYFKLEVS